MIQFLEKWSELIVGILSVIATLIAAYLSNFFGKSKIKKETYRKMYENSYSPVNYEIEKDLLSEDLTHQQIIDYGLKIEDLMLKAVPYFSPLLKIYSEKLIDSTEQNYQDLWQSFSKKFIVEYTKFCNEIGMDEIIVYTISETYTKPNSTVKTVKKGNRAFISIIIILFIAITLVIFYIFYLSMR